VKAKQGLKRSNKKDNNLKIIALYCMSGVFEFVNQSNRTGSGLLLNEKNRKRYIF